MSQNSTYVDDDKAGEYTELLWLLYSVRGNSKNNSILSDYLLQELSGSPEKFIELIGIIKNELQNAELKKQKKMARR